MGAKGIVRSDSCSTLFLSRVRVANWGWSIDGAISYKTSGDGAISNKCFELLALSFFAGNGLAY